MKKTVIKIGSSSLLGCNGNINKEMIVELARQISRMKKNGTEVCLVSSGAIIAGVIKLGLSSKPKSITKKQACAAVGQMCLMQIYEEIFEMYNLKCAQILVNHEDFCSRNRIAHLTQTMDELIAMGIVPIINENDALAVDEIKVGDNDTLSALIAMTVKADELILITDVDGLYDMNPSQQGAKLIKTVEAIDEKVLNLAGGSGSEVGTGGMATKIKAAQIATGAGIDMLIIGNKSIQQLSNKTELSETGTLFIKNTEALSLKKSWIKYAADAVGGIAVDDGAENALKKRKSLLKCGIKAVLCDFLENSCVEVKNKDGKIIAKGLTNYSSETLKSLLDIEEKTKSQVVIHADNLVLTE